MITERQSRMLEVIIDEYINTANPVSSGAIFELGDFGVSCPTIRNEMADLTEQGYLFQPHTSAGRVPTEQGYRFFVDELTKRKSAPKTNNEADIRHKGRPVSIKHTAQEIRKYVRDAVLITCSDAGIHFFGLKKLFSNPEFKNHDAAVSIFDELDRLAENADDWLRRLPATEEIIEIFIGSENPFFAQSDCSMIILPFSEGFISLLGPTRMNYRRNISIFEKFLQNEW